MSWCLVPKTADKFKAAIIRGEVDPSKLMGMSSKERRAFFEKHLGKENAEPANKLFESKMLLKHQQQGMITWATRVLNGSPDVKKDVISRIGRIEKLLSPAEEKLFLEDLVAQRLGTRVSHAEAAKIAELSQKVESLSGKKGSEDFDARMEYGRAVVELTDYVDGLKADAKRLTVGDLKARPVATVLRGIGRTAGFSKSIASTLDHSALLRQGWRTLWAHPRIWKQNAIKSTEGLVKRYGGKNVLTEVMADIQSRKNYDLMRKAKLDVGVSEEAFPTSLKGRVFKASEDAYTIFLRKTRADMFDHYIKVAQDAGTTVDDTFLTNVGRMVNSLTGRGELGRLGSASDAVNVAFFSPRNIKGHIDVLLHPVTGGATVKEFAQGTNTGSAFVRKEAAKNLAKVVVGTASILVIANAVAPDSVDFDPRSANFGKIKWRNTRFNVTGGQDSILTLAARMATGQTKNQSGEITALRDPEKTFIDFFGNKLSPAAGTVRDFYRGRDFDGNKMSLTDPKSYGHAAINMFTPLPARNTYESMTAKDAAPLLATMIADGLGISTNTYESKAQKMMGENVDNLISSKEFKRLDTNGVVDLIKMAENDNELTKLKVALRKKANNAKKRKTLTEAEIKKIREVMEY